MLGAGFEPAEPFRATVLQTVAIDHSAIPACQNKVRLPVLLFNKRQNLIALLFFLFKLLLNLRLILVHFAKQSEEEQ